jgi:hypothetical protein
LHIWCGPETHAVFNGLEGPSPADQLIGAPSEAPTAIQPDDAGDESVLEQVASYAAAT